VPYLKHSLSVTPRAEKGNGIHLSYCWQYRLLFYISTVTAATQSKMTIYVVYSYLHIHESVSHYSAATGIICEPTDIAVGSTHYLFHIVLVVHVGMASCHPYKFHRCFCHGHSCSYGLFGRTRLNTPCLGWNWRLFCHGFLSNFRFAVKYSICSVPPFCSRSFCMAGMVCAVFYEFWVKINSSDLCLKSRQLKWNENNRCVRDYHSTIWRKAIR
jgi:hypothetical protein